MQYKEYRLSISWLCLGSDAQTQSEASQNSATGSVAKFQTIDNDAKHAKKTATFIGATTLMIGGCDGKPRLVILRCPKVGAVRGDDQGHDQDLE